MMAFQLLRSPCHGHDGGNTPQANVFVDQGKTVLIIGNNLILQADAVQYLHFCHYQFFQFIDRIIEMSNQL